MSEHHDYLDAVLAESHISFDSDKPEPLENWTLEDFEDVVRVDAG
jgi:hypothetical protein